MAKIKCCGMTNLDDCRRAEDLGVDFIGFVFYKKSKRWVSPGTVRRILGKMEGNVLTVGVFVEENDREIEEIMGHCGLDFAQVYRKSTLHKAIRGFRVADNLKEPIPDEGLCLFDSYSDGFGGSGKAFDLSILPREKSLLERSFIAGGINEHNVTDVLRLRPFGVDLVSSLEAAPGRKDAGRMERFIKTVRSFVI
jgi:phosphoribosylanthranilate isomerase